MVIVLKKEFRSKAKGYNALLLLFLFVIPVLTTGCAVNPAGFDNPATVVIGLYTGPLDHLSAVSVGECPMYPSCSHYALNAIKKHGPVIGWFMACDRLIRCGRDALNYAPKVPVNGKWKYFDPVIANDFWWQPGEVASAILLRQNKKEVKWKVKPMDTSP